MTHVITLHQMAKKARENLIEAHVDASDYGSKLIGELQELDFKSSLSALDLFITELEKDLQVSELSKSFCDKIKFDDYVIIHSLIEEQVNVYIKRYQKFFALSIKHNKPLGNDDVNKLFESQNVFIDAKMHFSSVYNDTQLKKHSH